MTTPPLLTGPGYSVRVPPGFNVISGNVFLGAYWLLPPGSDPNNVPAIVQIRAVQPFDIPVLLQNLYNFENPYVATANAANLSLANVLGMLPVRQVNLGQALAHVREFDAVTLRGFPVRVMVLVMQGVASTVEVIIMVNLYRWVEFMGPCMQFIGGISVSGAAPAAAQVRAVVDKEHPEQVEFQLVHPGKPPAPLTALPTAFGNVTIVNIDNSIKTGDINGTGVVVGNHSTATVTPKKG